MTNYVYTCCGDALFPEWIEYIINNYEGTTANNDPGDSGGWTKFGICQLDVDPKTNRFFTEKAIKALTMDQAIAIYKTKYWDSMGCSNMPAAIAIEVLDFGINSGIYRAISTLQHLIYSELIDGIWGPSTLNDLKYYLSKHSLSELVNNYADYREQCYILWSSANGQEIFRNGWLNRNNNCKIKALALI